MSEERVTPEDQRAVVDTGDALLERSLVTDTIGAVVTGVSGGVAGAVVTQAMTKLGSDKGKDDKKS